MALGIARLALDLLLATRKTGLRKTLPRFPSFGNTPGRVDRLSVDDDAAIAPVIEDIAQAFSGNFLLAYTVFRPYGSAGRSFCAPAYWFA